MGREELMQNVELALENVRPYLKADGGDIELVEITGDNKVMVKFIGTCQDCPMSLQTLKNGVEVAVKKAAPEITEVVAV